MNLRAVHRLPFRLFRSVSASYWFLPTLLLILALAVAALTLFIDYRVDGWPRAVGWLTPDDAGAIRTLMGAIAGSMITVAGVAFSLTIAAFAHASGTFGPRLITNFMSDRGNQVTLGVFVATFAFCITVLVSTRGDGEEAFLPRLSVITALGLTLASLTVLIYFIHHVPEMLNISNILGQLGHNLQHHIAGLEEDGAGGGDVPPETGRRQAVNAPRSGYVQNVNRHALIELAAERGLVVRLACPQGGFAVQGRPLLTVAGENPLTEEDSDALAEVVALGDERTANQDIVFIIDQLVEVAVRALSPAVNDPFTAITAMNWAGSALCLLARKAPVRRVWRDEAGAARLIETPITFETMADHFLDNMRPHVHGSRAAGLRLLQVLRLIAGEPLTADQRRLVARHARAVHDGCATEIAHPRDMAAIAEERDNVLAALRQDRDADDDPALAL
ncbi:DUF2254 domain-containing protein [Inquilinus sp. CAU 1745]|uniref:DUF2254 domain-containing protein n=1 Tax=Inquilinus sp. CAU 1745 TaxID=3140369 RepID=UPI00325AFF79